jgi:uncharacterized protein (TIGR02996 family)
VLAATRAPPSCCNVAFQSIGGSAVTRTEYERALRADPEDVPTYLAYAEWLTAQGDPRGELIALQHAGERDERAAKAAAAFLELYHEAFLGPLAELVKTHDFRDEDAFAWRNGFIRAARLSVNDDTEYDGWVEDMYESIVGHPSGQFLTELRVGLNREYDQDLSDLVAAIVRAPAPLRYLHLGDFEYPDECEMSWYTVGALGDLWRAVPKLRTLIVQGAGMELGELDLPEARHVELRTGGLPARAGNAIATAKLPSLEHLEVWYGTDAYDGECGVEQVRALLARRDLPRLRRLGLKNADFGNEICAAIPTGILVRQLTHLDLSMSVLDDDGAAALAAHREALAHLEELNVSATYVTAEGVKALQGCAKRIVADALRDDEDPEYRFVSVGE